MVKQLENLGQTPLVLLSTSGLPRACLFIIYRGATCDIFSFFVSQGGVNVELSFFEIYNEKIHDLLGSIKDKLGKRQNVSLGVNPSAFPLFLPFVTI